MREKDWHRRGRYAYLLASLVRLFTPDMKRLLFPVIPTMFLLTPAEGVDFREEVRPILNDKCFKCHSGPRAKGKLRMDDDSYFAKRIGGEDPAIIPGDPVSSLLAVKAGLPRSDGDAMPPPPARERGAEPMTTAELNLVKQWIAEGAKLDPSDPDPAPAPATETTGAMSNELHNWTNTAGKSLEASFVSSDGTNVTLRKADGSQFDYPLASLNAESQALANRLAAE